MIRYPGSFAAKPKFQSKEPKATEWNFERRGVAYIAGKF